MLTLKQANELAKKLGFMRGRGTYNGDAYWLRPGNPAIITRNRLAALAGLV